MRPDTIRWVRSILAWRTRPHTRSRVTEVLTPERVTIFLALLLLAGVARSLSPPKPAVSEYMRSTAAGFAMTAEDGVQYAMTFAIDKPLGGSIYATVLFENPEKGAPPLRKDVTLATDAKELVVKSDRLTSLHNNKKYLVEVRLYSDENRSRLISIHKQEVLFLVPKNFTKQIQDQFNIKIN
jgi:hypothetical protein